MAINHVKNIIESGLDDNAQVDLLCDVLTQYFNCYDENHFEDVSANSRSNESKIDGVKYAKSLNEIKTDRRAMTIILFNIKDRFNGLVESDEITIKTLIS